MTSDKPKVEIELEWRQCGDALRTMQGKDHWYFVGLESIIKNTCGSMKARNGNSGSPMQLYAAALAEWQWGNQTWKYRVVWSSLDQIHSTHFLGTHAACFGRPQLEGLKMWTLELWTPMSPYVTTSFKRCQPCVINASPLSSDFLSREGALVTWVCPLRKKLNVVLTFWPLEILEKTPSITIH